MTNSKSAAVPIHIMIYLATYKFLGMILTSGSRTLVSYTCSCLQTNKLFLTPGRKVKLGGISYCKLAQC